MFWGMVHVCGRAIKEVHPRVLKVNLALCGNNPYYTHPHIHLLPRHEKDRQWPQFFLNHQQPYWDDADPRVRHVFDRSTSGSFRTSTGSS